MNRREQILITIKRWIKRSVLSLSIYRNIYSTTMENIFRKKLEFEQNDA